MKQIGSEDARRKFRDILDDAQADEATRITRNGKPVAVLVPAGWYTIVCDYIHATTFTKEAADFYARERAKSAGWMARQRAEDLTEATGEMP